MSFQLTLFPHQVEMVTDILSGEVRRAWNVAARGSGKSGGAEQSIYAMVGEYLTQGEPHGIWYFTPTITGTGRHLWSNMRRVLLNEDLWPGVKIKEDKIEHTIRLDDVMVIMRPVKGRDTGEHEGPAMHYVIFEEAGNKYMPRELYDSVEPAVTRVNGQMLIIGTPPTGYGENQVGWFRQGWDDAKSGTMPGWKAYNWRVFDNPIYGGIILPGVDTVPELALMDRNGLNDYLEERRTIGDKMDEYFDRSLQHPQAKEVYQILSKGSTSKRQWRKAFDGCYAQQMTEVESIIRDIKRGEAHNAARKKEGAWLPREAAIGEEELAYVKAFQMEPERFSMDSEGELMVGMGALGVWDWAAADEQYVIVSDASGGTGGDYMVTIVIRRPREGRPARVVAVYRTNTMAADEQGKRAYHLAMKYNFGLTVVERTGGWGVVLLVAIRNIAVERNTGIFIFDDSSKEPQLLTSRDQRVDLWGWSTTTQTDSLMFTTLRRYLKNKMIEIPSEDILREMITFDWENLKGTGKAPDDCMKALAMGIQAMEWIPVETLQRRDDEGEYRQAFLAAISDGTERPDQWQ